MKITAPEGPIAPGTSGKINVSIATTSMRTMKYRKQIEVVTNDPIQANLTLTVLANIKELLSVQPYFLNFGQVKQGSKGTAEITLANNGKDPIAVTQLTANPVEQVTISPRNRFTLKPGDTQRVIATFTPGKAIGHVEGSIIIKASPGIPDKTVFVRAEIVPQP